MVALSRWVRAAPGLVHVKGLPNLTSLSLYGTLITDVGLVHLTGLASLTRLYLYRTKITNAGEAEIRAALPNCFV